MLNLRETKRKLHQLKHKADSVSRTHAREVSNHGMRHISWVRFQLVQRTVNRLYLYLD